MSDAATFLIAYNELVRATENDPEILLARWQQSERLCSLCTELYEAVRDFEITEEFSPLSFTPHVLPASAEARRDFETRWRQPVAHVALMQDDLTRMMMQVLERQLISDDEQEDQDPLGSKIDDYRHFAADQASRLHYVFEAMADNIANDDYGQLEWQREAINVWDRLTGVCGLDVEGVLWRRRAIPHILVPDPVSALYGANQASLYQRLFEAAQAFVFGSPRAALALQRAVMEEVLETHWGAERGHIREAHLPELSWDSRADRLKRLANDVLHGDPNKLMGEQLYRAVIENFGLLRLLIENAPPPSANQSPYKL